jgi:predicted nucleotidyltransferase
MENKQKPADPLWYFRERAKELECLYKVEDLLLDPSGDIQGICREIIKAIPPAWQYPEVCQVKIALNDDIYESPDFREAPWCQGAEINVSGETVGSIKVYYVKKMPQEDEGPFLKEETKLVEMIAERLGNFIAYQKMRKLFQEHKDARSIMEGARNEWKVLLELLQKTDRVLFFRISHKMLNHLCWMGIEAAQKLVQYYTEDDSRLSIDEADENRPFLKKSVLTPNDFLSDETFKIAADNLTPDEIISFIQRWIQQDKLSFLLKAVINLNTPISGVVKAINRYKRLAPEGAEVPAPAKTSVLSTLIRRFFSEQLEFINIAKSYVEVSDFFDLVNHVIFLPDSYGKLGGKSAGLFLASQILYRCCPDQALLSDLKVPKTWYITSDAILTFANLNNFEEVIEQKYKEIYQVRIEYPNIVQTFKSATFPPEIIQGLSMALDDFKDKPLIVRSSSLLEDRMGSAFSGKYRSLFLANQGSKEKRLEALLDAVAEVYASVFGPDPIEYRAERGLLDFHEEMGIMIQEVVGTKAGKYYLPAYAGVAFSKNEFRWSPRIKREDGLVRLVPGLGTRAVDRLSDDYPVLVSPGQPGLRVNVTTEEIAKYSPHKIDVINLETNSFESIDLRQLLREIGADFPAFNQVFSIIRDQHIQAPTALSIDQDSRDLVVAFDGLFARTPFLSRMQRILKTLEEKLGTPVDIEFASDGKDFYLLQCRPQSQSDEIKAVPIPRDIPSDRIVFSANRFVSNGRVPDITHIVYVDPEHYGDLQDRATMLAVGRAIGKLNKLLPKRQFILMGPGRWGSRGDIKMGVSVTYSDINNTAVLIEIARKSGNYVPDLSFGTHFFQDLVEANIRYLPLYPDDPGIVFNEGFLASSPNLLPEILSEFTYISDTIRLIDVPAVTEGKVLQILMNADLGEAVGVLAFPRTTGKTGDMKRRAVSETAQDSYWPWRLKMAEHIASQLDPEEFGVKGFYLFGSTKTGTAGPSSDIDVLVHFGGTPGQEKILTAWLDAWSLSLDQMNYLQTGYKSGGLLDFHIITDEDIGRKTSYAVKIGAPTDPARQLPMKRKSQSQQDSGS